MRVEPRRNNFYPRSPCGERREQKERDRAELEFLSTLSLRRATLCSLLSVPMLPGFLSTLSLRRATTALVEAFLSEIISIHALLAESDPKSLTRPCSGRYFYPRSPCGERRPQNAAVRHNLHFYPRSPCGERHDNGGGQSGVREFLSTLSLRRATRNTPDDFCSRGISIHALLAESDLTVRAVRRLLKSISIHALLAESDCIKSTR